MACNVMSQYPITSLKKAYSTTKVLGKWIAVEDKSDTMLITMGNEKKTYTMDTDDYEFVFYISKIKGKFFVNFLLDNELKFDKKLKIPKKTNFAFMELFFKGEQLGLAELDIQIIINAIKSGELKGDFDKKIKDDEESVELESDTRTLYKFFKKYAKVKKNIKIVWYNKIIENGNNEKEK